MLSGFPTGTFLLLVFGAITGVALAISLAGWIAGRLAPPVRFVAPYALAALACWGAGVQTDHRWVVLPVVTFVLAALAVTIPRAMKLHPGRAGPAEPDAPAGPPPRPSGAAVILRIAFIAAAALSGGLLVALQHEAVGAAGFAAALAVTWTLERQPLASGADHRWPRRFGWAVALSVAALAIGAVLRGDVLVGLPEELPRLRGLLAARVVALVALAFSAMMLIAREARRSPRAILVEALAITLPLFGGAALLVGGLAADVSGLDSGPTDGDVFEPPRGWTEVAGLPAPIRRYDRNDGRESVTVAPVVLRGWDDLDTWCRERDLAIAQSLASASFGPATLRVHRLGPPRDPGDVILQVGSPEDYSPCAFRADLVGAPARRTVAFRLASGCNDARTVVLLHAWSDDWENARGTTAVGPTNFGANEIVRFVRCRGRERRDDQ